jgi:hypothetical protein
MLLVSMCLIYIHAFCLLTSIYLYVLLNFAGVTTVFCFVLNFMVRFKYDSVGFFYKYCVHVLFYCL